jgi:ABC-type uncharacterized transport system substrate-binding protein
MKRKTIGRFLVSLVIIGLIGMIPQMSKAAGCKVLVVMSYHAEMDWVQMMSEGINATLAGECEVKYFYLDTRRDFDGGPAKAQEAYALYGEWQPDGVIAADDNAQEMFVVPYLKDQVSTPVMFCGVNADPAKYGYPASNVSGILERMHIKESIAFLQQLVPTIKTVGYLAGDNSTAHSDQQQVQAEADTYPVESLPFHFVDTLEGALAAAKELSTQCDAAYIEHLVGIKDQDGEPMDEEEVVPLLVEAFGKPTFSANVFMIEYGILCAVVKTGQEQGRTVSEMLLQAMQGTLVSDIPITQNQYGRRILNVTTLKALGIKPKPKAIRGVELVKTQE